MPISFYPRAGQILMCDLSGFAPPEINKTRPVIIISPKLPHRSEIVAIVPISLTAPQHNLPYVVKLSKNYHPLEANDLACWAKCDMLLNIGRFRLNGFKIGRRKWEYPQATGDDLKNVRDGVLHALGLERRGSLD